MSIPSYEVFAIKYAERDGRRPDHFLGGDPHDAPMPLDYYVWLVRSGERTVLVDTGFDAGMAAKRNRRLLRAPHEALRLLGVAAADIRTAIVTHLHNDHVGTFHDFRNATFHLQDREMSHVTGRSMRQRLLRRPYEIDHVAGMVQLVYRDRVAFHDGDAEIAPGISVHLIGGHTAGMQSVRVHTRRGWVVLASDASHLYEHFENGGVFPVTYNPAEVLEGYRKLKELADSPRHIVPGHDPLVLQRYPAAGPGLDGIAVELHAEPVR